MSVILSACRHTKQRAIARALKKRAEKQKLKKETELQELEAVDAFTKMWSFEIEGEYYSVVLYLASEWLTFGDIRFYPGTARVTRVLTKSRPILFVTMVYLITSEKETVDIFVNEDEIEDVNINCTDEGATFDFVIGASYKARISCCGNPQRGLVHSLTIGGYRVPEVE